MTVGDYPAETRLKLGPYHNEAVTPAGRPLDQGQTSSPGLQRLCRCCFAARDGIAGQLSAGPEGKECIKKRWSSQAIRNNPFGFVRFVDHCCHGNGTISGP